MYRAVGSFFCPLLSGQQCPLHRNWSRNVLVTYMPLTFIYLLKGRRATRGLWNVWDVNLQAYDDRHSALSRLPWKFRMLNMGWAVQYIQRVCGSTYTPIAASVFLPPSCYNTIRGFLFSFYESAYMYWIHHIYRELHENMTSAVIFGPIRCSDRLFNSVDRCSE